MSKVIDAAIVTVRNSSSRLPNKAIMKITNDLRSIDIILERAKKTKFPVFLATSISKEDDIFVKIAKEHHVSIFRGSLLNKIHRWYHCFTENSISNALLIDGDDLSCNFEIGQRAINEIKSKKVDLITHPSNIVTGFFTYAITKEGISKMYQIANDFELNTDVITRFIEKANLSKEYVSLLEHEINENIRLTLDYVEDLEFFRKLYEEINILSNGKTITNHIIKNPNLLKINFHRQKDFLDNQAKFNDSIK